MSIEDLRDNVDICEQHHATHITVSAAAVRTALDDLVEARTRLAELEAQLTSARLWSYEARSLMLYVAGRLHRRLPIEPQLEANAEALAARCPVLLWTATPPVPKDTP